MTKQMNREEYQKRIAEKKSFDIWSIIKDAWETLNFWPDHPNRDYYLAEIEICEQELRNREEK